MKPRTATCLRHALLPLLAAALFACTPSRTDMNQTAAEESAQEDAAPLRKPNPQPQRAYTITLRIKDAPGPFASVEGVAQYDVENDATCGRINALSGTAGRITSNESFELRRISDTEYQGMVYADLMVDEDYYGRGICRWQFTRVQGVLKATGAQEETEFLPSIDAEQVFAQQSVTKYFWSGYYPRAPRSDNYPDFGDLDLSGVPSEQRHEFFTLTLSAKEAMP